MNWLNCVRYMNMHCINAVFFFKQKTAYEMRISDWSSDVCSSDLKSLVAVSTGLLRALDRDQAEAVLGHEVSHVANGDMVTMTLLQGVLNKIGRASCRDRACPYV